MLSCRVPRNGQARLDSQLRYCSSDELAAISRTLRSQGHICIASDNSSSAD